MEELEKLQIEILRGIHEDLKIIAGREKECMDLMRSDIKELKMMLTGVDGQNGIRSVVKKHEDAIDRLTKWQTQFMAVFAVVQLIGVPVAIYVITHLMP